MLCAACTVACTVWRFVAFRGARSLHLALGLLEFRDPLRAREGARRPLLHALAAYPYARGEGVETAPTLAARPTSSRSAGRDRSCTTPAPTPSPRAR